MNWIKDIDCCGVAVIGLIVFCLVIVICFAMFFNYSAKLSKDRIELTKLTHRTEELEKKNGKEQTQLNELKQEIQDLKKKLESRS